MNDFFFTTVLDTKTGFFGVFKKKYFFYIFARQIQQKEILWKKLLLRVWVV